MHNNYQTPDWPASPPLHLLRDGLSDYDQFLSTKMAVPKPVGIDVPADKINAKLFKFQNAVTRLMLHLGRGAIFGDLVRHQPDERAECGDRAGSQR